MCGARINRSHCHPPVAALSAGPGTLKLFRGFFTHQLQALQADTSQIQPFLEAYQTLPYSQIDLMLRTKAQQHEMDLRLYHPLKGDPLRKEEAHQLVLQIKQDNPSSGGIDSQEISLS